MQPFTSRERFVEISAVQGASPTSILFPQVAADGHGQLQVRTDGHNAVNNSVLLVHLQQIMQLQMFTFHWIPDVRAKVDGTIEGWGRVVSEVMPSSSPGPNDPYAHGMMYILISSQMLMNVDEEPFAENEFLVQLFDDTLEATHSGAAGWVVSYDYAQVDGTNDDEVVEWVGTATAGSNVTATFQVQPSIRTDVGLTHEAYVQVTTGVHLHTDEGPSHSNLDVALNGGAAYRVNNDNPVIGHYVPFDD